MAKKGLMDEVFAGIGNAVTDVRQRVVEEGWFGRVVTGSDGGTEISVAVEQPSGEPTPDAPPAERGSPADTGPVRPLPTPPEPERPDPEPDMGR